MKWHRSLWRKRLDENLLSCVAVAWLSCRVCESVKDRIKKAKRNKEKSAHVQKMIHRWLAPIGPCSQRSETNDASEVQAKWEASGVSGVCSD